MSELFYQWGSAPPEDFPVPPSGGTVTLIVEDEAVWTDLKRPRLLDFTATRVRAKDIPPSLMPARAASPIVPASLARKAKALKSGAGQS